MLMVAGTKIWDDRQAAALDDGKKKKGRVPNKATERQRPRKRFKDMTSTEYEQYLRESGY